MKKNATNDVNIHSNIQDEISYSVSLGGSNNYNQKTYSAAQYIKY